MRGFHVLARTGRRARLSESFSPDILGVIPDAAVAIDSEGSIAGSNGAAEVLFGARHGGLRDTAVETLFEASVTLDSPNGAPVQVWARRLDGRLFRAEFTVATIRAADGRYNIVVIRDATESFRAEGMKAAEAAVLEQSTSGASIERVLDVLARGIESVCPEMQVSVSLRQGDSLMHAAAPSLPDAYIEAVRTVPIGDSAGSCGTAAYRKKLVVVADIATDPLWANWRLAAMAHGLRACWSNPILGAKRDVLGTFAMYYRKPGRPDRSELHLIEKATKLAGIAIGRDLAEFERKEAESRYRTLSELTSDFAYAFALHDDGTASIDWVTDAFSKITGYSVEEWEERGGWRGIVHPDDMLTFEQRMPRLLRGEPVNSEVRIVTKSGDVRWLAVYSRPDRDEQSGRVVRIVGAAQDFTSRKEAEDAKTMFLATASHELKTPLTVIRGFAQMVSNQRMEPKVQQEAAETIERRAIQLNKIVDRILLSSRIETGRASVTIGEVDVNTVLAEVVDGLGAAVDRPIELTAPELPIVAADPVAVVTVLDHLIDNALKYSPGGGTVRIDARADEHAVLVSVADDGLGMSPEQVERCFEKFWQAESTDSRRFGGTGIGLFIVRSLVEAMGGDVRVTSQEGNGSTFTFSLRRADASAPEAPEEPGVGERTVIQEFMRQIGVPSRRAT